MDKVPADHHKELVSRSKRMEHVEDNQFHHAKLGNQIWTTKNLNIEVPNSWTHPSDPDGSKFGRYYTWYAAFNAIPNGWHLPSDEEWHELLNHVGVFPGLKLREGRFGVLLAGFRSNDGLFYQVGCNARFWSSSGYDARYAWSRYMLDESMEVNRYYLSKIYGFSVRCVKN